VRNSVSGQGGYHFGVLKKPTDPGSDVTTSWYQEAGVNEGLFLGGSLRRIVVWVGVLVWRHEEGDGNGEVK
jgi:hypothetical protein